MQVMGIEVELKGTNIDELDEREIIAYVERGRNKYGDNLRGITITVDGEWVDLEYDLIRRLPFQRLRRVTGYLVGTLDRWNDGKRAEERERVKHGVVKEKTDE